MRKWIEVRVWDEDLIRALPLDLGTALVSGMEDAIREFNPDHEPTRLIRLAADSPRWQEFWDARERVPPGVRDSFGDFVEYRYAKKELLSAELLRLEVTRAFEPEGELCGTVYDESAACPRCGAGRQQKSDLHLQLRRAPQAWPSIPQAKHTGIAKTIADEIIVSHIVGKLMQDHEITGAELRPVRSCGPNGKVTPLWHQLWVTASAGRTIPPTEFGVGPFKPDPEGEFACPRGHVSGLNLLSEVYVKREDWEGADISATEDLYGCRRGVLVPAPAILITQRFYRLLMENNVKGFKVEVAHLV